MNPSSCNVERSLSLQKLVHTLTRNPPSPGRIDALLFMLFNSHLLEKVPLNIATHFVSSVVTEDDDEEFL